MKKRISAFLLCLVLCLSLMVPAVFAVDTNEVTAVYDGRNIVVTNQSLDPDIYVLQIYTASGSRYAALRFDVAAGGAGEESFFVGEHEDLCVGWQIRLDGTTLYTIPAAPTKPDAPANVKAKPEGSKVTVTWDEVPGVDGYEVTCTPKNGTPITQTVSKTTCEFTDLEDGEYTFSVVAKKGDLKSDAATTTATVKNTPAHTHEYDETKWESDKDNHWHVCRVCNEKVGIAKHTWDKGVETTAPTATKAGVKTYTCTVCGKTRTESIPATGGSQGGKPGGSTSGSHGSGNVGKPGVVGGNQSGGNQGGDQPTTGAFSDVQTGAYYADAVQWAVNQGITTGTTGTTFSPNNPCTRAQIVTFLWRANGSPAATGANPFTDVAQGAYYYDAVLWAVEKGITTGTTASTFSPNNTCTRAQAVTFLHRSAGTPAGGSTNPFTDVGTDAYYTNAVLWAVEKGVTGGTTATTFSPNSTCTRAQIVTFLYRAQ